MKKSFKIFCLITRTYFLFVFLLTPTLNSAQQEADCCIRSIGVPDRLQMPPEQEFDRGGDMMNAFFSQLAKPRELNDCPLAVEGLYSMKWGKIIDLWEQARINVHSGKPGKFRYKPSGVRTYDYVISGYLSILEKERKDGHVLGTWNVSIQLMDPINKQTLKTGSVSCEMIGDIKDGKHLDEKMRELGRVFMPMDDIIYDYERIPTHANILPDEEEIMIGEEMVIELNEIRHGQDSTQPWQWILIEVEHGEIEGAIKHPSLDKTWIIQLGGRKSLALTYKAPRECENKMEKLTVYNSCQKNVGEGNQDGVWDVNPNISIGTKEFKIVCTSRMVWQGAGQLPGTGSWSLKGLVKVNEQPKDEISGTGKWTWEGSMHHLRQNLKMVVTWQGSLRGNVIREGVKAPILEYQIENTNWDIDLKGWGECRAEGSGSGKYDPTQTEGVISITVCCGSDCTTFTGDFSHFVRSGQWPNIEWKNGATQHQSLAYGYAKLTLYLKED